MSTAVSPQLFPADDPVFEGLDSLVYRGLADSALNTVVTRLGGALPLTDPRRGEIERQKRIFLRSIRRLRGYPEICSVALITATENIRKALDD